MKGGRTDTLTRVLSAAHRNLGHNILGGIDRRVANLFPFQCGVVLR
jgi:hypothetical protein